MFAKKETRTFCQLLPVFLQSLFRPCPDLMRLEFRKDTLHLWVLNNLVEVGHDGRRNVFCFETSVFNSKGLDLHMILPASGCSTYFTAHGE